MSYSTISISNVTGLKNVFEIIISWLGWPINGVAFGLFVGDDDGVYTIYDSENNIYRQYNLYEIRDQFNALLYEVRQSRGNNIDFSKNFTNITG